MDLPMTLMTKVRRLCRKQEPKLNLLDLPTELLEHVASFVPRYYLKNFALASKKCLEIFQLIDHKSLNLISSFKLDEKKILEKVKDWNYISLNLSGCFWLSSATILELISKEAVRELYLIGRDCSPEMIEAIAKLNLSSLSISLTESWQNFFISNETNSVPFLKRLKKLTIYHQNLYCAKLLLTFAPWYILQHCSNLEYLKLFTYPTYFISKRLSDYESFQALNIPTPVPKLESLILDFHLNDGVSQDIKNLLELIFNKKEIPLKRLDLRNFTASAILDGLFVGKNISFEQTSCCLSFSHDEDNRAYIELSNVLSADGCESLVDSMLKSPFCTKIFIEGVHLDQLRKLSAIIVNSGNTSIKQISLKRCYVDQYVCVFVKDICDLNSRITCLNLSCVTRNWNPKYNSYFISSLSNLRNLHTLHLAPFFLTTKENKKTFWLKLSLWDIAYRCKSFSNLEIIDVEKPEFSSRTTISQKVLMGLKDFKNLQYLRLAYFGTAGDQTALPVITKSCARLKYLLIDNVHKATEPRCDDGQMIEKSLAHTKQLKHLSIIQYFKMTKQFADNLSKCTKVETLRVEPIRSDAIEANEYFAHSLKNLPKLGVFITRARPEVIRMFESVTDKSPSRDRKPIIWVSQGEEGPDAELD